MGRPGGAPENLKPWKPGQSGNPKGMEKGYGTIKKLTQAQVKTIMDLVLTNDVGAIERIRKDPKTPLLQAWICSIALKGFKTGDHSAIEVLLARSIGKLKDNVEVSGGITVKEVSKNAVLDALKRDKFLDVSDAEYQTLDHADSKDRPLAPEALQDLRDHSRGHDLPPGQGDIEAAPEARTDPLGAAEGYVAPAVADPLRVEVPSEPDQAQE